MAISINSVTLAGNLGHDPEIRTMQNGDRMAAFSLATTESWKDKASNEWKNLTIWHRIAVYNPDYVDFCEKNLKKGSAAVVHGKINVRKWQDKQGIDRETSEIVVTKASGLLANVPTKKKEADSGSFENSKEVFDTDIPF